MAEKENLPIDFILDKFVEKLYNEGKQSANEYKHVKNAFEVDGAFVPKSTNKEDLIKANVSKNFLELVPKYINIINNREVDAQNEVYNINEVITWINDYKERYDWEGNGKKSYKSYINSFLEFIKDVCNKRNNYEDIYTVCSEENFSSSDLAILNGKEGDVYLHNRLATKFKSRLRSQDRTSGDKVWLPLRFIAKIYSKDKKNYDANHKERKENQFSNWLNMLVDDIYIHYVENGKVKKVRFGEKGKKSDVHLRLAKHSKKGQTAKEYNVYVRWVDNNGKVIERRVLTPTGRGNEKKEMVVSGIQAIAIDHVKPIDLTLRDLESKLQTLQKVSDKYKELCENEKLEEDDVVNEILGDVEINLDKLKEELDFIRKDGLLRLMDSKYNSKKSNGETFQKIILRKNKEKPEEKEYVGILEAEAEVYDDNDERVYYYQRLTDDVSKKIVFHVTKDKIVKKKKKSREALEEILNLV